MMLSDQSIFDVFSRRIHPFLPERVQPASYDLSLGDEFSVDGRSVLAGSQGFWLMPGMFALAHTVERVEMPATHAARLEGRSSWGRLGLMAHVTAGFIDPGFEGQVTLELFNAGPRPLRLTPGLNAPAIAQLSFFELDRECARPYGAERGSHYAGQSGATGSRLDELREVISW